MDRPLYYPVFFQNLLGMIKVVQTIADTKSRKFPLNNPGKPHKGPHVPKLYGAKGFFRLQGLKSHGLKICFGDFQLLVGKRKLRHVI